MPEYQIRPIGRPKVERASNGLRRITRRYVVQGEAVAAGNIESQVFLAFGTVDAEYASLTQTLGAGYESGTYTSGMGSETINAYLIQQFVEPSEEVTQAFLTRVYQELDATPDPVQVDKDAVQVADSGLITLQRKFIVKNPYIAHYDPARIGVDNVVITHSGKDRTCYLGKVESQENEVFTEFTETFFEDAILSLVIEYRNGLKPDHKLEIRTIRAIEGASALDEPSSSLGPGDGRWYLVSEREGSGSADFGQMGRPVHTRVWAKGRGIVNFQQTHKHDGALEMVSIRALGEQSTVEDAGTAANGATFHRVSESLQESSGHQVFSDTYAAGKGRISVATQSKGPIDVVSETWISEPGGTHSSELENILSTSVSKRDGFDLHSISGTSHESGVINVSRQYKNRGTDNVFDLEIVRVTKIGAMPTSDEFDAAGNGAAFVLIAEGKNDSGQFTIYTGTFAAGVGTIQTGERNTGKITVKSYTSLNTDFPSDTYDQTVSDRDGYVLRTYRTYEKDSTFTGDKSKRWINKFVYQENKSNIETSAPTLTPSANDVAGSYRKQAPSALWSTTDTDVTVDSAGVISANIRYVPSGNYFQVTKTVASASGATASTYAPDNSVLIGQATSYERGWVRDTFTWAALSSSSVSISVSDTVPWTLPGVIKVSTDTQGTSFNGRISRMNPARVSLPVVKKTTLSTSPLPIPDILDTPWAGIDVSIIFNVKKDPYILDETLHNWVGEMATTSIPMWTSFNGFNLMAKLLDEDGAEAGDLVQDHHLTLSGWAGATYNSAATDAYLSASQDVMLTDGTNTIYRLQTVQGSPTVNTSAV